ncbi:MBL fold metallo-hydrolase [Kribbella sp. CA-293567]|uniref:MBL fold metallo-hydrolase n=1 Tax=Kribbella sp. CA-293567 TaxID=3002436 RepID=UPI0022DDB91B|nr:MBL fold metallo-hydrolase [Kribbella sp. CA-293567]WBQ04335.1 MBL fold metallo-hydrolase [Kribbella sp. CA-293567]
MIDTGASYAEGRELARAVRSVTPAPWSVVNTHAHVDHILGNAAFGQATIWGHHRCRQFLARPLADQWSRIGVTRTSRQLAGEWLVGPNRRVHEAKTIRAGTRKMALTYVGRAHTDNDLIVSIRDAGVVFAGDLIREGGMPWIGDGYPLDWPQALERLEKASTGLVVPGHGRVTSAGLVHEQRMEFTAAAARARELFDAGASIETAAAESPLDGRAAVDLTVRAYAQLSGRSRSADTAG